MKHPQMQVCLTGQIWHSHSDDYEDNYLVWCIAV